jgi:hypothetical protein
VGGCRTGVSDEPGRVALPVLPDSGYDGVR